ncbi:MAG: 4-hydroxybenzoyl-CoA thioesterase family active site [uncultured Blastococcus sp.]|uniref:4-hydroxybenzoyl-CoA thioesterase family active site n=1 Tax=uncultured Blastococcus sp. TaxID=217144 RepID=A0A6J4IBL3_9ACTN|nr:MAG: 4-hydroxybenzoyl-CoA thioesterase family active site [uncultured Blastococcus sp.]
MPVPVVWSSPVRFVECDQQGIVFNAHYLVWADEAVNVWWERRGVDWARVNARGLEYVVVASSLEWRSSARWGDTVEVDAELEKLGRTSVTVRFVIRVAERESCVVRTTYVCTADGAPTPWPDDVRNRLADA